MAMQIGSTWSYCPSGVLLAALEHINHVRRQDAELKKEIEALARSQSIDYERAKRAVLARRQLLPKGLLRNP